MSEEQNNATGGAAEEETYNLVFFPQMEEGSDYEEVRDKLAATLKVDKIKVDGWYDAESPTVLLKGVAKNVAERYMEAIMQCGGACNIQPSSQAGGLSLVPKSKNVDFFICPSCEHEEEIPRGTVYEQCPKCGLVMAKWEEKMREEAEKEKIRRRMLRDQRHENDREADFERKRAELERLRRLEAEIMKELGIKPPSRFWRFFEKHPFAVASVAAVLLIAVSGLAMNQIKEYLLAEEARAERNAPVPEGAKAIAPAISAAVALQQNGNQAMIAEMASMTTLMHGGAPASQQEIIDSAQQMMKGVDPQKFIDTASKSARPGNMTRPGPEGQPQVTVNTDTVGGVSGIPGIERFEADELDEIVPPVIEHGHEKVMMVLTESEQVPDPLDPSVMMTIEQIEDMDGSMIVDLMKELSKDQEWDRFLAYNARIFLGDSDMERASALIDRIRNPVIKIEALGDLMVRQVTDEPNASLKLPMARVYAELEDIADGDIRARSLLAVGRRLADAGYPGEPEDAIARVNAMIQASAMPYDKAYLSARLAIAWLHAGNRPQAKALLGAATGHAGRVASVPDRISAFTRIAQRYYDARNPTLANEILGEAQILAATRLEPRDRSRVFAEIAIAQGYMGDLGGALASIDNAGEGAAEQQVLARLAEFFINLERFYDALSVMDRLTDPIESNRLEIRLITAMHYAGMSDQVRLRLDGAWRNANRIDSAAERGIVLSQYGRLARRAGLDQQATTLFEAAALTSDELRRRELAVNLGVLGLEQARALMPYSSQETMFKVEEAIVKDPVSTEIQSTVRIIDNLMPESVRDRLEPEPEY